MLISTSKVKRKIEYSEVETPLQFTGSIPVLTTKK